MKKLVLALIIGLISSNCWADSKLSALSNNSTPAGSDLTYDVASGTSYNITLAQVAALVLAANVGIGTTTPQAEFVVYPGNVGIGTWTAGQMLDVAGTSRSTNVIDTGITASHVVVANGSQQLVAATNLTDTAYSTAVGANPSASVGLAAVNGSSANFIRADGAPALSQSIVPTWTGTHTFNNSTYSLLTGSGNVGINSATPGQLLDVSGTTRQTGFVLSTNPTSGYVLTTNNIGVGTWAPASGGSGTPGGSNTQIQFNNSGSFGGNSGLVYSGSNVGIGSTVPGQALDVQGNIRASNYITSGTQALPNFTQKLQNVLNQTGNARVCLAGDSTVLGIYSTYTASTYVSQSIAPFMSQFLNNDYGVKANWNGFMGDGTTSNSTTSADNRLTLGSSWTQDTANISVGGGMFKASTTTNALQFTPTVPVTTFRYVYLQQASGGHLGVAIDAGSVTNIDTSGTASLQTGTISTTLGTHTIKFTYISGGQVDVVGVSEAYDNAQNWVNIVNMGWSSADSINWNTSGTGYAPSDNATWTTIGCDLTVYEGGINDWENAVGTAPFTTNMTATLNAMKSSGDIALLAPVPSNPSTINSIPQATQQTYQEALQSMVTSFNIPFIDIFTRWGSWAASDGYQLYNDLIGFGVHPVAQGYAEIAKSILSAIIPYSMKVRQPLGDNGLTNMPYIAVGSNTQAGATGHGPLMAVGNSFGTTNSGGTLLVGNFTNSNFGGVNVSRASNTVGQMFYEFTPQGSITNSNTVWSMASFPNDDSLNFADYNGSTFTKVMTLMDNTNNNNVGIGTFLPSGLLEIGNQKFDVLSGGNVGIGSINPGQALDVNGTVRSTQVVDTGVTASKVVLTNVNQQLVAASNLQDLAYCQSNGTNCPAGSGINYWLAGSGSGNLGISTVSPYNVGIGTTIGNAGLVVMSGNIGINTWNPTAELQVIGNARVSGLTASTPVIADSNKQLSSGTYSGNTTKFLTAGTISGTGNICADGSGNAITTGCTGGSGSNYWLLTNAVGNVGISTIGGGGNTVGIGTTMGSAYLTIIGGNVGIGTWNPSSLLSVGADKLTIDASGNVTSSAVITGKLSYSNGEIFTDTNRNIKMSTTSGDFYDTSGSTGSNGQVLTSNGGSLSGTAWKTSSGSSQWTTINTQDVYLPSNGNVGLGTTLTTTSALTVMNGNIGIGTWKPTALLNIMGGNVSIGTSASSNYLTVGSASNVLTINSAGALSAPATVASPTFQGGTAVNGSVTIKGTSNSSSTIDSINFNVNGTVKGMTIVDNGGTSANVGIGTIAPVAVLGIVGNVGIGTGINSPYVTTSPPSGGMIVQGNIGIGTTSPQGALTVMSGNVGIGTWSPIGQLQVIGGNMGIGTTIPNQALVVKGSIAQQWGTNIPVITSCGTSPTVKGTDNDFAVTVGSVAATGCTATFGGTYQDASCIVTNQSMSITSALGYTVSSTAVVVSQATGLVGDILNIHCGFKN